MIIGQLDFPIANERFWDSLSANFAQGKLNPQNVQELNEKEVVKTTYYISHRLYLKT